MENNKRGEVSLTINDEEHKICLTLGALAMLESKFAATSLSEISDRLEDLCVDDLCTVLAALLYGCGETLSEDFLKKANIDPGEAVRAVSSAFTPNSTSEKS